MSLSKFGVAKVIVIVAAFLSCPVSAFARNYRKHPGYVDSTIAERGDQSIDLQVIEPLPFDGPPLKNLIFNDKLSSEFEEKYNDKFGRTDAERVFAAPNRTSYYNDVWFRGSPEEYSEERRKFADYMIKRLVEYHVDDFTKNNPKGRAIYEFKESVSNVNVKVATFQFDLRYEIAGNTADFIVKNPYLSTAKVRLQMNPGAFVPGAPDETIVTLGNAITSTISFETYFSTPLNNISFVGRKQLGRAVQGTVSLLDAQRDLGPDRLKTVEHRWIREKIYLAGIGYTF